MLNMFRAKWNHSKASRRQAAVEGIVDTKELIKIATSCKYGDTATLALNKLTDESDIASVAKKCRSESLRTEALSKITSQEALKSVACAIRPEVAVPAAKRITDEAVLKQVLEISRVPKVQSIAADGISDSGFLTKLLIDGGERINRDLVERIIDNVDDQDDLERIAATSAAESAARHASPKLKNELSLYSLASIYDDWEKAIYPVKQIKNQLMLVQIFADTADELLRLCIIPQITDLQVLAVLCERCEGMFAQEFENAAQMLQVGNILGQKYSISKALRHITDQNTLLEYTTHETPTVRLDALENLQDQDILAKVAREDAEDFVQIEALLRITDQDILFEFLETHPSRGWAAAKNIFDADKLNKILWSEEYAETHFEAVANLADPKSLLDVAKDHTDTEVRLRALQKMQQDDCAKLDLADPLVVRAMSLRDMDEENLLKFVDEEEDLIWVDFALGLIKDQHALASVTLNHTKEEVRDLAVRGLTDQKVLKEIYPRLTDDLQKGQVLAKIEDEEFLADLLPGTSDWSLVNKALKKISDQSKLGDIYLKKEDGDPTADLVLERITDTDVIQKLCNNETSITRTEYAKAWLETIHEVQEINNGPVQETPKDGFLSHWAQEDLNLLSGIQPQAFEVLSLDIPGNVVVMEEEQSRILERLTPAELETMQAAQKCLQDGMNLANEKMYDAAIAAYQKCLDLTPWNYVAWKSIGSCHFYLNDHEQAETHLLRSYALEPHDPSIWSNYFELFKAKYDLKQV